MNEAYYPSKKNHIAKMSVKLDEPNTAPKTFWSIISRFLEQKKIPAISPILPDSKLVFDFKIKFELFNSHCCSVYSSQKCNFITTA